MTNRKLDHAETARQVLDIWDNPISREVAIEYLQALCVESADDCCLVMFYLGCMSGTDDMMDIANAWRKAHGD